METRFMVGRDPEGKITNQSPLGDLVARAMSERGARWNAAALRAPGCRAMAHHEDEERSLLRVGAPFPERAQIVMDNAVVKVGRSRLTFVNDLINMGLTYPLTDPLSKTVIGWNAVVSNANAQRSMTPEARTENSMPSMTQGYMPVYLTLSKFEIGIRELRESQRMGMPLDTAGVEACTRAVNEDFEDAAFNGFTSLDAQQLYVAGYTAYGLLTAPNANTDSLTASDWDTTPSAANIMTAVQGALAKLRAAKKFGPYIMYVNTEVGAALDNDYVTAAPQNTIRERLLKLEGLKAIRTADLMPATKVAIVQMTNDVVDLVVGQEPTVIPWTSASGFTFHNLVMGIIIPRFRSDANGKSGIWIGTIA